MDFNTDIGVQALMFLLVEKKVITFDEIREALKRVKQVDEDERKEESEKYEIEDECAISDVAYQLLALYEIPSECKQCIIRTTSSVFDKRSWKAAVITEIYEYMNPMYHRPIDTLSSMPLKLFSSILISDIISNGLNYKRGV